MTLVKQLVNNTRDSWKEFVDTVFNDVGWNRVIFTRFTGSGQDNFLNSVCRNRLKISKW